MENSPPGIQAMPSGAGPGAAAALATVGSNFVSAATSISDDVGRRGRGGALVLACLKSEIDAGGDADDDQDDRDRLA